MTIFKRKPGPVLRWSRFMHFMLAATLTGYGAHLWGDDGVVFVGFGALGLGLLWEISNKVFGGSSHPYGDVLDFWAFVAGALTVGLGWYLI